ncbi:MAG: hypothetical protein IT335_10725, partial [Thermomicrobiales bacterium]|nr:hypothetical protein [Thermomicrobiales bacterium]
MNFSRSNSLLIGIAVLLLIPVVLAAIAPLLAPIPAQASSWTAPPLPERDEPLPDFQHLIEPLPIVVRDLPDTASQDVVAIYDVATLTDNQTALQMVEAASNAIPVPPERRSEWDNWVQFGQSEAPPRAILDSLQGDPQNADRLSNLAAAIYFSNKTQVEDISYSRERQSWLLLQATTDLFPGNRNAFLNYAFVSAGYIMGRIASDDPIDFAEWLTGHRDDPTALTIAVELVVNHTLGFDLDSAALAEYATALSKSSDTAHAALGHALLGDLQMARYQLDGPDSSRTTAPYELQSAAHVALEHYDTALQFSDDPSIYAARALMLSILGDIPAAIDSQQRAVDLQPDSLALKLQLVSHYLDLRGSVDEMRRSIETAREIEREAVANTLERAGIQLAEVRFLSDTRNLVTLVANRPAVFYAIYLPGMAGAGYGISFTEIPIYNSRPEASYGNDPLSRAVGGIVAKSEALGDADGMAGDVAAYIAVRGGSSGIVFPSYVAPEFAEKSGATARLVADYGSPSESDLVIGDVNQAAGWLRFMGSNRGAMQLCQEANELASDAGRQNNTQRCIGENAYLVGDYKTAQQAFEAIDDPFMAGYVAHRRGNLDDAKRFLQAAREAQLSRQYDSIQRLGDIALESGQPGDAIQNYDEWLAWAEAGNCYDGRCLACVIDMCQVLNEQFPLVYSNRGVATLQLAT